jgi:hypothetical protein
MEPNKGEIVMYQPDETIRLEVRVENETVWLTQQQMAELFQTTRNNITLHIGNIFKEGELVDSAVRKESLLTAADGKKYKTKFYNLDVIISVGYRVKSIRGTKFRQWATRKVNVCQHNHDRFLIIDDAVYIFGASLKDAGKKLFAYIRMQETSATELLNNIR